VQARVLVAESAGAWDSRHPLYEQGGRLGLLCGEKRGLGDVGKKRREKRKHRGSVSSRLGVRPAGPQFFL